MKNITIIGAGWLGLPLAQQLRANGHQVSVTRTRDLQVDSIKHAGLHTIRANLDEPCLELEEHLRQSQTDVVIGCFPPKLRQQQGENYAKQWQYLVDMAQRSQVKKIVMVSSTSVYPSVAKEMREQDATLELAIGNPLFSDNARSLLQAEYRVQNSGLEYVIVRCSGLIGPERHPARFVAKMAEVSRSAPANLLHLDDAIGCVIFAATRLTQHIVNATTPNTVSKAEFYQHALCSVDSPDSLPNMVDTPDKRIVSEKIVQLGYKFHYQHTLDLV